MPTFNDALNKIPGLTHFYPLDSNWQAKDAKGGHNGAIKGTPKFTASGAVFDGMSYIQIPDHNDFSISTKGALTVIAFLTVSDWRGAGASEYVHWMGKGSSNQHEWTFRHYVKGGTGEAPQRQGRTSFYVFNARGGLGAGSFFQDTTGTEERMVVGQSDLTTVSIWRDGTKRDSDPLSGYSIKPSNTSAPVCIGSRGDNTGYLIGKVRNVCFFNRVLTDAEIKSLYAARGLAVLPPATSAPTPAPPTTAPAPSPTPDPTPVPPVDQYLATGSADVVTKHNDLVRQLRLKGLL